MLLAKQYSVVLDIMCINKTSKNVIDLGSIIWSISVGYPMRNLSEKHYNGPNMERHNK